MPADVCRPPSPHPSGWGRCESPHRCPRTIANEKRQPSGCRFREDRGGDQQCGREDLNLHGFYPASTSSWCVCQFRHDRVVLCRISWMRTEQYRNSNAVVESPGKRGRAAQFSAAKRRQVRSPRREGCWRRRQLSPAGAAQAIILVSRPFGALTQFHRPNLGLTPSATDLPLLRGEDGVFHRHVPNENQTARQTRQGNRLWLHGMFINHLIIDNKINVC